VVLADAFATGKPDRFYVVPIDDIRQIITDRFDAAFPGGPESRPVSPAPCTPTSLWSQ
jgi:hypothetical protein